MNRELPSPADLVSDMQRLSFAIDDLVNSLREQGEKAAREDCAYRLAYSRAVLAAKAGPGKLTVLELEATADIETIDQRVAAKVAEALADSAKQALLARRSQLSALQSVATAVREELSMARTGPNF